MCMNLWCMNQERKKTTKNEQQISAFPFWMCFEHFFFDLLLHSLCTYFSAILQILWTSEMRFPITLQLIFNCNYCIRSELIVMKYSVIQNCQLHMFIVVVTFTVHPNSVASLIAEPFSLFVSIVFNGFSLLLHKLKETKNLFIGTRCLLRSPVGEKQIQFILVWMKINSSKSYFLSGRKKTVWSWVDLNDFQTDFSSNA